MAWAIRSKLLSRLFNRNFMMSATLRAEEALDEIKKKNPYFEKYASKINHLKETAPEEFIGRINKVLDETKPKKQKEQERTYSEILNPKKPITKTSSDSPQKKLSDLMKIELIQDKSSEDIQHIWFEYHKNKDVVTATLTVEQYELLMKRGKEFPTFLFALPRSEGYEFIMLQFSANTIHFTPLLAYQVHKENAPECLNIVHYTETKDKGIILMRGEYDNKIINPQEAQCLANQLQLYYYKTDENKLKLLESFTKEPSLFKHSDLISEMENITLK